MVLKMCFIYILAVNPKRNAGIDQYQNIPFQWLNRNEHQNGIHNYDLYYIFTRDEILSNHSI